MHIARITGKTILLLLLLPSIIGAFWLSLTENGLHWAYHQASINIPGEVIFGSLQGRLIGPITISQLDYQFEHTEIRADRINLDWSPLSLFGARMDITQLHVQALNITRHSSSEPAQDLELPEIYLPWQLSLRNVVIDDVHIRQSQQDYYLNQFRLDASSIFDQLSIETLNIQGDTFGLELNGLLTLNKNYPHKLDVRWYGELPSTVVLEGKGQLVGNMDTLKVQQHISGPLNLNLQGELRNLLKQPVWQANIDVSQFNSVRLDPGWPAVKGKLRLQASGDLSKTTITGEAQGHQPDVDAFSASFKIHKAKNNLVKIESLSVYTPDTKTRLNIKGDWQPPADGGPVSGDVDLKLEWQNLRWPMQQQVWFSSASGKAKLTGNINQYHIDLTTDSPLEQLPLSSWHILAKGNQQGLDIQRLSIQTLDGIITSKGRLNWSEHLSWQASTSAHDINPGLQWSEWPGSLDATLTSQGTIQDGVFIADASIEKLQGQLRGNPLSLNSRLHWQKDELTIHQLDLTSGVSSLTASGRVGPKLSLDWSIMAENIAQWVPQAKGKLQAQGQLSGTRDEPNVKASVKGRNLRLQEIEVGRIAGTIAADLNRWKQVDIRLSSKAIKFRDYALQSMDIDADSGSLQAKIISEPLSAQIRLNGSMVNDVWQGQLEQADFQSLKFSDWRLTNPVKLRFDRKSALLDNPCWKSQQATICSDFKGKDKTWHSKLTFNKLPLNMLKPWLAAELTLEGTTDGNASIKFNTPDQITAQSQIDFSDGKLNYQQADGESDTLEYRHGNINLTLDDAGLRAKAKLSMSNDDQLRANLAVPGLNPFTLDTEKQTLQAQLSMDIKDYSILETVLPEVRDIKGDMQLNLSAAGTLGQPGLSGSVHLKDATARIPRLGLSINKISLKGQSDEFENFNFELSARSGEGLLTITGQTLLDKKAGWPSTLQIRGDSIEVSRIPEARVQVSPDLTIRIEHRNIDISGDVLIPFARLQPKDITTAARVSDDVVIIGSEQQPEEKWAISSKVRVTLGDLVNFFGFGFEGRIDGSLLLEDNPGQPTRGTGDIKIPEGRYKAYGQNLEVEQGRLLFTGGPVVNPGLDLRAIRRINEVTAGLRVKGTLHQPQIELYSIPAMGQTNALSYLLFGRPLENASDDEGSMMAKAALALSLSGGDRIARSLGDRFGLDEMRVESSNNGDQASLVVGRYLSPKLYVSYGVGLIDSFNTLNIRYQLSDKWQLKGESGENQGADLLYTMER